jgi:hypothetical protein
MSDALAILLGMTESERRELVVRTGAATLTGLAGMLGPDAAFVATSLQPGMEAVLLRVTERFRRRWNRNAGEMLDEAAAASGKSPDELLLEAADDDRKHELLARALGLAQDMALREKRQALGRAVAAGFESNGAGIDDELMFIRAVADLDAPHIQLLTYMDGTRPSIGEDSGTPFIAGWSAATLGARLPGLSAALPALLSTLQTHSLIRAEQGSGPYSVPYPPYNVTLAGRHMLVRLREEYAHEDV